MILWSDLLCDRGHRISPSNCFSGGTVTWGGTNSVFLKLFREKTPFFKARILGNPSYLGKGRINNVSGLILIRP